MLLCWFFCWASIIFCTFFLKRLVSRESVRNCMNISDVSSFVARRAPHFEAGPCISRALSYSPGPFPESVVEWSFQFRPMFVVDSIRGPSPAARKPGATAAKQLHSNSNCHNRNLVNENYQVLSVGFPFFQDPKQRHDTAQSPQPPVQTHPCKEHAHYSWDHKSKLR